MNFNERTMEGRAAAPKAARNARGVAASVIAAMVLAACGGGGDGGAPQADATAARRAQAQGVHGADQAVAADGTTHADAFRLLTQATFGPTDADVQRVLDLGVEGWLDEQLAMGPQASVLARWNADEAATHGAATSATVDSAIYQAAIANEDQLRQRVAYALSQIYVVSTQMKSIGNQKSQASADYYDMLSKDAFGNFRTLIEDVALHPAMGQYLSALGNAKEAPKVGRIPDQNFAREIMQLFTIGLVQLNIDGTPKLGADGNPIYTYSQDDIDGLSRVFTGWGWYGPDNSKARWNSNAQILTPDRLWNPMQAYPTYHSTSEKDFLGVSIPEQGTPDPQGDLKVALDKLYNHPNVGPFIAKQLIQRLVTSNPKPAYVARVAKVFNDDGTGVRGNMQAVVKAIFMDPQARRPGLAQTPGYGKVKEPVIRLTSFLRAYGATSDSGLYLIGTTDDAGTALAQSPLRSESVFNFYRPGYMNVGGSTAFNGLVAPELQITTESSVAGYANYMLAVLQRGVGSKGLDGTAARNDVQTNLASAVALADDSTALVDDVTGRLIGESVNEDLKTDIRTAVDSIVIPQLNKAGTNGNAIAKAKQNRAMTAVMLTLASPEFIVQR
jgi:uncharacterized protein (DUF1800 family)